MLKNSLKMSLIEDYAKILQIEMVCLKDERLMSIKEINEKLKTRYESLLFKYGLVDLSLLVLKKEIQSTYQYNRLSVDYIERLQKEVISNLTNKVKLFKLTDVEIDFLIKPLISNC